MASRNETGLSKDLQIIALKVDRSSEYHMPVPRTESPRITAISSLLEDSCFCTMYPNYTSCWANQARCHLWQQLPKKRRILLLYHSRQNWPIARAATDPGLNISPIEGECLVDGFSATRLHPNYTLSRFLVEAFEIVSRNHIDLYKRLPVRTLIHPIRNPYRNPHGIPTKAFFW